MTSRLYIGDAIVSNFLWVSVLHVLREALVQSWIKPLLEFLSSETPLSFGSLSMVDLCLTLFTECHLCEHAYDNGNHVRGVSFLCLALPVNRATMTHVHHYSDYIPPGVHLGWFGQYMCWSECILPSLLV